MKFKVGDKVRVNKQATIEDFSKDWWNGCQFSTLNFLRTYADKDEIFIVTEQRDRCLRLKEEEKEEEIDGPININIFELVERKEVKEMTIAEIEKELGYPIKVVKEEE